MGLALHVFSQVMLSMLLPFTVIPLVWFAQMLLQFVIDISDRHRFDCPSHRADPRHRFPLWPTSADFAIPPLPSRAMQITLRPLWVCPRRSTKSGMVPEMILIE
ncbi:hypothetical protein [Mesorhizobium loti]|uniref:hypothetical protein n=1 Tax=Rhizobium loti TaxID=381 RepID=UPI00047A9B40|nr:hypothetical protein [Mesorhizobium loti]